MSLSENIAQLIFDGFENYLHDFDAITSRAKQRFERGEWKEIQREGKDRLSLYKRKVAKVSRATRRTMQMECSSRERWTEIKALYLEMIQDYRAKNLSETFYNSVCRKVIDHIGAEEGIMFVRGNKPVYDPRQVSSLRKKFKNVQNLGSAFKEILADGKFSLAFEDLDFDIAHMVQRIQDHFLPEYKEAAPLDIEYLPQVFYRNKGAYMVGCFHIENDFVPFAIPILCGDKGLYVDAMLWSVNKISIIFSFTRSHFMVETENPSETVRFLRKLMPHKPAGELYNSIGFNKHGKTAFFREFKNHMDNSADKLVIADGVRGMVMIVFTLPSYRIVFKLIKDKCDPPKKVSRAEVKHKYNIVDRHDRVGRMADTHEFEHFRFAKDRFDPALLKELLEVAPSIVHVEDDEVIIDHLYTERKMVPLNLYMLEATEDEARKAMIDFGHNLRQLAAVNIFPGDMFLKNFGLTRHRRIIFYDYDEIGFVTDYNFRKLPPKSLIEDVYADAPYFAVDEKDVFPEEFKNFLAVKDHAKEVFLDHHGDIFTAEFWLDVQAKVARGEVLDVFPYPQRFRFRGKD